MISARYIKAPHLDNAKVRKYTGSIKKIRQNAGFMLQSVKIYNSARDKTNSAAKPGNRLPATSVKAGRQSYRRPVESLNDEKVAARQQGKSIPQSGQISVKQQQYAKTPGQFMLLFDIENLLEGFFKGLFRQGTLGHLWHPILWNKQE